MSKKANPPPPVPVRGVYVLLGLAVAESALAVFQWAQLQQLRAGGRAVCALSDTVNCETVWSSPFATAVHELVRMPIAALGLVWGLAGIALCALYLAWRHARRSVRPAVDGLRLLAAIGVAACVVLAIASALARAVCLTCLGTLALVLAFAVVSWRMLPGPLAPASHERGRTLGWTLGALLLAYLALLPLARALPGPPQGVAAQLAMADGSPASLERFLQQLSGEERQQLSDALADYRGDTPLPARSPARRRYGPADAPVKLVEWTDSKCPHCKSLVEAVAELKRRVPEGRLSVEARHFPLDSACNPAIQFSDGSGVRCLAAKAQICLETAPDFWALREKLFAAQAELTSERILSIASSGSMSRKDLEACIASPSTAAKLQDDIAYARQHDIHGTPLVVVNGREAKPMPALLYALAMTGGDPNAPAFASLPPPRPRAPHVHE